MEMPSIAEHTGGFLEKQQWATCHSHVPLQTMKVEGTELAPLTTCLLQWVRSFDSAGKVESVKDLGDILCSYVYSTKIGSKSLA